MPQAVRHDLHQHRFVLGHAKLPSFDRGGIDCQGIVAVDPNPMHAIARSARDDAIPAVLVLNRGAARERKKTSKSGGDHRTWAERGRVNIHDLSRLEPNGDNHQGGICQAGLATFNGSGETAISLTSDVTLPEVQRTKPWYRREQKRKGGQV